MGQASPVQAVIFDMDGVLIDSEPLWRRAQVMCYAEVGLNLQEADCEETMGQRIDAAVGYWYGKHPWPDVSIEEMSQRVVQQVKQLILAEGQALPGVEDSLKYLAETGLPLAVASSSWMLLIEAVMDKLAYRSRFKILHSAEDEMHGKPAPDVYLTTARKLGVAPENCLAIEDSCSGVQSAFTAGMQLMAVPAAENAHKACFQQAHHLCPQLHPDYFKAVIK